MEKNAPFRSLSPPPKHPISPRDTVPADCEQIHGFVPPQNFSLANLVTRSVIANDTTSKPSTNLSLDDETAAQFNLQVIFFFNITHT